jgi:predicted TIM-barrel fold metal-dependent hydrolase
MVPRELSRRQFLTTTAALTAAGCCRHPNASAIKPSPPDAVIDIHQHTQYSGRTDEQLFLHQKHMGVTRTLLLPAGHPVARPSTHDGKSNGLAAQCGPNETCYAITRDRPDEYFFFANETPDVPGALREIEKYLRLGALGIGEQKFNVDVESPASDGVARLAADYGVPVLCHFQHATYNLGFERFWRVLEKHHKTRFIAHAQTTWVNISKDADQTVLYPKIPVVPGGPTDRYLTDYPNFYADISAGSGLGSMLRDEKHARGFLERHQDKIMYGSDCNDRLGKSPVCQGAITIATIRRLAPGPAIAQKILHDNAARMFGL